MSYQKAVEPVCTGSEGSVDLIIEPRAKDLGGFTVRRVLPSRERRMVGPFIFFDHMGPAEFPPGEGIQVRGVSQVVAVATQAVGPGGVEEAPLHRRARSEGDGVDDHVDLPEILAQRGEAGRELIESVYGLGYRFNP